jgi:hypothetical protein
VITEDNFDAGTEETLPVISPNNKINRCMREGWLIDVLFGNFASQ